MVTPSDHATVHAKNDEKIYCAKPIKMRLKCKEATMASYNLFMLRMNNASKMYFCIALFHLKGVVYSMTS